MLNKQGFNLWADDYDQTVQASEESNTYPFAGYKTILNTIFNEVMQKKQSAVLDIGFGTGTLTTKLYEFGHRIDGIDFSSNMISKAQAKMPDAQLVEWDISNGLPDQLKEKKYDSIVSTYALHHLTDQGKVQFITELLPRLKTDGHIYIGDVAFSTRDGLEQCRQEHIDSWDNDEFYFVYEEMKEALQPVCLVNFHPLSHCGGVLVLSKFRD